MADNEDKDYTPAQPLEIERPMTLEEQVETSKDLQTLLLLTYVRRLKAGTLSDTGLAALQRLLHANGWSLDPAQLPKELSDMLTSKVDPAELDDEGVLPLRRKA